MDLTNVTLGGIYNTYVDLCTALGTTPACTRSKPNQLKLINQYVKYHRRGRQYIIDEVYDKPHLNYPIPPRRDRRKKLPSRLYTGYIKALLLQELARSNGMMIKSRTELMRMLGMANSNYASVYARPETSLSYYKQQYIKHIYYTNFRRVLDFALQALVTDGIITMDHIINLITADGVQCKIASPSEVKKITETEKVMFHSLDYRKIQSCLINMGYAKYFHKLKISLNPKYEIVPLDPKEIDYGRKLLNEEVIEGFERLIQNRHSENTSYSYQDFWSQPLESILDQIRIYCNFFIKLQ